METAKQTEKAMIEEMITEDILTDKLNSETGSVSDEYLKNKLQNQYGTIQDEDDNKIYLLTYDYIDDTQYRDRYEIEIDKISLLTSQSLAIPSIDTTMTDGRE